MRKLKIKNGVNQMKMLVCTDGSENSQKTLERAAMIAGGCQVSDVAVIHVYDNMQDISTLPKDFTSSEQIERFRKMMESHKKERYKILEDAVKYLESKGIKARPIFKEGHPSHTIVQTCAEGNFDMIVIGSRGTGGLKKVFLGSVSNAVTQEAKNCTVMTVK